MSNLFENDLPADHYCITVTSTENQTITELRSVYDYVSDAWNESKYTPELHESLREVTPSTGDKVAFLKKFDRGTTNEKAIEWAKSHSYRLAFPFERVAFTRAHPHLQRQLQIVDLGSYVAIGSRRYIPILTDMSWRSSFLQNKHSHEWRRYAYLYDVPVREDETQAWDENDSGLDLVSDWFDEEQCTDRCFLFVSLEI